MALVSRTMWLSLIAMKFLRTQVCTLLFLIGWTRTGLLVSTFTSGERLGTTLALLLRACSMINEVLFLYMPCRAEIRVMDRIVTIIRLILWCRV